jgi:hypothetical protein
MPCPAYIVAMERFPTTRWPLCHSSMKPTAGLGDHFTRKMKSCHTPRTSFVRHGVTLDVIVRRISSPYTKNSTGGEPQHPSWCHCVKSCHVFTLGKSGANITCHR